MPADAERLRDAIGTALAAHANPLRAQGQQAYMKSELPYYGLTAPQLRAALRPVLGAPDAVLGSRGEWEGAVRLVWDTATHREERYAALAIAGHPRYRAYRDREAMPLWRDLVVAGAWWDVVDDIATHGVRASLLDDPEAVGAELRKWALEVDVWLRRSAIICQVGLGERLDEALLVDCIAPNLTASTFFIRKAIGWALRDHARVAPDWVRAFVAAHAEISELSRREATKHLADVPSAPA